MLYENYKLLYPLNLCRVTGKLVLLIYFRLMLSNIKCFGVPPQLKQDVVSPQASKG